MLGCRLAAPEGQLQLVKERGHLHAVGEVQEVLGAAQGRQPGPLLQLRGGTRYAQQAKWQALRVSMCS
jgi:hypothetical protein